jgi:class 3 adenylate cyclase
MTTVRQRGADTRVRTDQGRTDSLRLASRFARDRLSLVLLTVFSLLFLLVFTLYANNFLRWAREPDFGWSVVFQMDRLVLAEVHGRALAAGLRAGDRVVRLNGKEILSFHQLQNALDRADMGWNVYEIRRAGLPLEISVVNIPLGPRGALVKFGLYGSMGVLFFFLGAVVIFMKPGSRSSRAFLAVSFASSLYVTFSYVSRLMPEYLNNIFLLATTFLPATVLQLTALFPVKRAWVDRRRGIIWYPFVPSTILFFLMRSSAPQYGDVPRILKNLGSLYLVAAMVLFLVNTLATFLWARSTIARRRSQVVLMGSAVAIGLPVAHLVLGQFFGRTLVENAILVNLPLYFFFPLSIAYSIARHNLFDVDVYVKRAVGYVVMTVLVGSVYFSLQLGVKGAFAPTVFAPYVDRVYPALLAVLVVFFFNPVNIRIQGVIDRLFYRKRFDYKDTVTAVSDALTSVLNLEEIKWRIIQTVRRKMFIDTAGIILLQAASGGSEALIIEEQEYGGEELVREEELDSEDLLLSIVRREEGLITKYDIDEDSRFAHVREPAGRRLASFGASLALPMIHQGEVTGILTVGHKKSGHFYTREDIDLLETVCNQGAVAIENARLADQMKQEEKVRTNLARYLSPQVVEQVIHQDVEVDLGGNRKVVTVLFSDIRGFTAMAETRPPDQLVAVLNEYFTEMGRIIFEHQGSLDKFIGDAIVAVFGSLVELDNPAEQAVKAAIRMVETLSELNTRWSEEFDGITLRIGIGINTGEVLLGNVGSPERMEFTVIGDAVNLAEGLSDLANPGQILLTEETASELSPSFPIEERPPGRVKGKAGDFRVYEVLMKKGDGGELET